MNIRNVALIIFCFLITMTSMLIPVSAAKTIKLSKLSNPQILIKVMDFNDSKLSMLNWYISHINPYHPMAKSLITLYQKLDDLIVSDISVANELNETANSSNSNSIGCQLENLFSFLDTIVETFGRNPFEKSNPTYFNRYFAPKFNTKIKKLFERIDQVSNL